MSDICDRTLPAMEILMEILLGGDQCAWSHIYPLVIYLKSLKQWCSDEAQSRVLDSTILICGDITCS